MALKFANNNSLSAITSTPSGVGGGSLNLISTSTASSSSTISFTSGIDSTYDEYVFKFYDIHPATDATGFTFQADTGTNTNYNQTITSTHFQARHNEDGSDGNLAYNTGRDQAQGTAFQPISNTIGNDNDQSLSGYLQIFNPSSSVFVKHFISTTQHSQDAQYTFNPFCAGYFNTTTALTRFQFKMSSGNIDSGVIKLYGVS
jgi:hypothetical protein